MTARTSGCASASSKRGDVSTPSADAAARAESKGSTHSTGLMTVLFDRFFRMVCPHHPSPIIAALIMRLSESCAFVETNLTGGRQCRGVQRQYHRHACVRQRPEA